MKHIIFKKAQRIEKQAVKWATKSLFKRTALCLMGGILFLSGSSQGCFIAGDLSGDCRVDIDDLVLMTSQWMQASCDTETGLVAHWKFNESSGTTATDSSGSEYNGYVSGASWNPTGGLLGGALQFDGIYSHVWITQGYQGITGSNPRTCAAWIKTDQPSGEIITWGNLSVDTNGWIIWLDETGVLRVDVGGGHIAGTTVLTDDFWHHITVTSDGSTTDQMVLYIDGRIETIGDGIVSQSINTQGTSSVKLGVYSDTENHFNGLIDDARIYDRVLTMKEIWTLVITGTTINSCPDLNADEVVNLNDFAQLSQNWGEETPPILINEFLADNESKSPLESGEIFDGNYESSDWIELHNNSEMVIDIGGWYLTDESDLKTKWQFPSGMGQLVLQPGDFLIVFASGKTQAENPGNYPYVDPAGYLHTNFELSKNGEYLGLIDAHGTTPIHEYNHFELGGGEYGYPEQKEDISYGCSYDETGYFSLPTPGTDNVKSSFEEFVEKPDVNIKGGCYENGFDLTMSCGTPDAFIRYTTDGTVPSLVNSTLYTGPIHIDSLTTIIAKAFKPGLERSDAVIETYIFIDPAVASFNSNLPIIVIDTLGVTIPNDPVNKTPAHCRAVIIDTDDVTGRADITDPEHFAGWGQIRRRGESTYGQGHYGFEVQDEYGQDKAVSLLGMPAESDWILSVDVIDYTLLKNEMAFKWFRDMGHYAPRQRFVEVYLNTGGGKISESDYNGLYALREKIKRNDDRVDIARLDASHNLEPKVTGGYIIKNDKEDTDDTVLVGLETEPYGIVLDGNTSIVEPGPLEVTGPQINWAVSYMNQFHAVLWQNTSSDYYVPGVDYTDYVEETSWIDHCIVEQIGNDPDAFRYSYFIHKDRSGKLCSGPPWDFDRAFHNNAGDYSRPYTGWDVEHKIPGKWHLGLQQYPEYNLMLADRWFEHREDVLDTDKTMAYIDETAALISEAMERSRSEWYFPMPFADEILLFKNWIIGRLDWLDGEIATRFAERPPIFSPLGGYVNQGDPLEMSEPPGASGTIYYTLNGEDPRLAGGAINPNASIFVSGSSSPSEDFESDMGNWINVTGDTDDWYRESGTTPSSSTGPDSGANGSTWYMYMETSNGYCNDNGDTAIIEGPSVEGTDLELSFYYHMYGSNMGTLYVDIYSGSAWTNGVWSRSSQQHSDDSSPYTQATVDLSSYTTPLQVRFRGVAVGGSKGDMAIDDIDIIGGSIAGGGDGLTLSQSTCVRARLKDGGDWSAQNKEVYAVGPVLENLRISELMYHPADPTLAEIAALDPDPIDEDFEFIELKNIGSVPINLNLVHFTDGIDFTFGDYTLAAGDYTVLVKNQAAFATRYNTAGINIVPGSYLGALDNDGEEIVLRDAIGAEIHDFDYNDSWYELTDGPGFSLTLVDPASTDPNDWDSKFGWRSSLYAEGTPGQAPETTLAADSIVVNELLARSHAANPDWIELYNTTGLDINISGWFLSDNDSDDTNIMKYEFQDNSVVPAYGYLTLEQDDTFGNLTADGCNIAFGLSEGGETVYLYSGQNGEITGFYQTQQKFDASETDVTFGRYEKAELSGGYDFVRQSSPSQDAVNNGPLIPAVVITEFYYNPVEGIDYEFVELYNRSGSDVTLMSMVTTETSPGVFDTEEVAWRLEGTGYEFPEDTVIGAGQYILVAKNPTSYSSAPCDIYGPYDGKLDNGGEELEIRIPGDQEYGKDRYWIPIEKIDYDDEPPWPTSADGDGDSLHRQNVNTYGRDYSNWQAATPTFGR